MADNVFNHSDQDYRTPDAFYRVSIKLLTRDDQGRFLLVRGHDGDWCLPGGGWDYGEDYEACLRREIQEELGVDIATLEHDPIGFWDGPAHKGKYRSLKLVLQGTLASHDFTPCDEAEEARYFTFDELEKLPFSNDEKGVIKLCRSLTTKRK